MCGMIHISMYPKSFEKLTFLTIRYAHVRAHIKWLKMLVFRKILRTYLMDGPYIAFAFACEYSF